MKRIVFQRHDGSIGQVEVAADTPRSEIPIRSLIGKDVFDLEANDPIVYTDADGQERQGFVGDVLHS
ncbi:MAG: hypothetical protein KY475_22270 [Planctomycetes bacterium]|nr:hypothetical protein [Planctomycetota bacterium]